VRLCANHAPGFVVLVLAGVLVGTSIASGGRQLPARPPDVPFVTTPPDVVTAMLELARPGPGDVLYDLGSGDGRIPIAAAQRFGIRTVGIEIDPVRIKESRVLARAGGVEYLVTFREADMFTADLGDASIVTMYLLPRVHQQLAPRLLASLKPGARVVTHRYEIGGWTPAAVRHVGGRGVFLYVIPH
jgi:precorrin-6B methylase 2